MNKTIYITPENNAKLVEQAKMRNLSVSAYIAYLVKADKEWLANDEVWLGLRLPE